MDRILDQEKLLNLDIARDMVDSFVCSTGVSCLLTDAQGEELYRREPKNPLYAECCDLMGDQACQKLHLFGANESERLGGRYFYFCPMGMGCIASPIVLGGEIAGALVAGPVRIMEREDHMASTPLLRDLPAGEKRIAVTQLLQKFPRREPGDLSHLSALLLSTALYIGGESRSALEWYQDHIQVQAAEEGARHPVPESVKAAYPLDKEQALIRAVKEGDRCEARSVLDDLLDHMRFASGGDFSAMRVRSLELMTLASRAAADGGADFEVALELNQQFLKESDYLRSADELTVWLRKVIERYSTLVFDAVDVKHKEIIYKAINYMKRNFGGKLTLEETARSVGFSPTYFSKIFLQEVGMSFSKYLGNLRVEHSKKLLLYSDLSVNEICDAVGFEDQSYFIKVFRRYTGVTPGKYRKMQGWLYGKVLKPTGTAPFEK
ncbi:MAG: helix-turn-helix domain-containing protein [Oscillospiraceae bacterium]